MMLLTRGVPFQWCVLFSAQNPLSHHEGLKDKSHARREPARKVTFQDIQEVRRLARDPDPGAYRVMAALEQIGIKLSRVA
jgi:hypothetical protein